jgi:hypothetical protein
MSEVTRILSAIEQGDPSAADRLLPLVYDELRKLAAQRLAQEKPGQTLEATALVREAYLRLAPLVNAVFGIVLGMCIGTGVLAAFRLAISPVGYFKPSLANTSIELPEINLGWSLILLIA